MLNGITYARVSSVAQVDGTSIEVQIKRISEYCKVNDICLIKTFVDKGQSAKSTDRKEFLRAIEFCRNRKNKVDVFVVFKVDRFARNLEDHFAVRKKLAGYGVSLKSVTETIGDNPTEKYLEAMLAASSEFDNSIRAMRSNDGMSARINQGIYPWHAPAGYLSQKCKKKGEKKNNPDPIDPDSFYILQQGLREYSTGGMTKTQLQQRLIELGLPTVRGRKLGKNFTYQILDDDKRLRFYAGFIYNPFTNQEVKGRHKPMITEKEYRRIRALALGKNLPGSPKRKYKRNNPDFPLRGTVLCHACGNGMTGSRSTNGKGGNYYYYHCEHRGCCQKGKAFRKRDIERHFVKLLARYSLKPEKFEILKDSIIKFWETRHDSIRKQTQLLRNKASKLEARKDRIQCLMEDGVYDLQDGKKRLEKVKEEILLTDIDIDDSALEHVNIEELLVYAQQFITDLAGKWKTLESKNQQKFQNLVFPEGIIYHPEKGFGTHQTGCVFKAFDLLSNQNPSLVFPMGIGWNEFIKEAEEYKNISID